MGCCGILTWTDVEQYPSSKNFAGTLPLIEVVWFVRFWRVLLFRCLMFAVLAFFVVVVLFFAIIVLCFDTHALLS